VRWVEVGATKCDGGVDASLYSRLGGIGAMKCDGNVDVGVASHPVLAIGRPLMQVSAYMAVPRLTTSQFIALHPPSMPEANINRQGYGVL
jgi:hypothetical protein